MTFFLLESSQLQLPHKCSSCGYGDKDRKYIDFGISVDYFGALYLCSECFAYAATEMGYIHQQTLKVFMSQKQNLEFANEKLLRQREALSNAVALFGTAPFSDAFTVPDFLDCIEARLAGDPGEPGPDFDSDESESGSDESDSVEGSNDVSDVDVDFSDDEDDYEL